nr:4013_t:CDS:2 [Entrophospora candida]
MATMEEKLTSALKRKRVDAHVGNLPTINSHGRKTDKSDLDLAKYELTSKFA